MLMETSDDSPASQQKVTKHHRKHSEANHARSKQGLPAPKRARLIPHPQSISSTQLANSIMKFRLGGSISDPLNLEGSSEKETGDECSTCAPSPALPSGQPSPLPQHLQRDPLNLEGKVKKFPLHKQNSGGATTSHINKLPHKKKGKNRKRSSSKSEDQDCMLKTDEKDFKVSLTKSPAKTSVFRYGNYDRYYGYRNSGTSVEDLRLPLLRKEWFEGKDCLDIGSNTGQITIRIARDFRPRKIVGIDIDAKLVRMAWKNLHREYIPTVAPDGRPFPQSLLISCGPPTFPSLMSLPAELEFIDEVESNSDTEVRIFPHNVEFRQCNYVPMEDALADNQLPEYDTILALSLTKWIHLNWGDAGIKRFFRKISNQLRPGGRLILEPQPFGSYTKKKKLTPDIFKNYQSIAFFPRDFHSYLMSPDVGFTQHELLGVPDNQSKGFRRPLHLYIKADSCSIQASQSSSPSQMDTVPANSSSTARLKSVVGDVSKTFSTLAATSMEDTNKQFQGEHTCCEDNIMKPIQTLTSDTGHTLDCEDVFV